MGVDEMGVNTSCQPTPRSLHFYSFKSVAGWVQSSLRPKFLCMPYACYGKFTDSVVLSINIGVTSVHAEYYAEVVEFHHA